MKRTISTIFSCCLVLLFATAAMAHFGMVIPATDVVEQGTKSVALQLSFSHPFEGHGMNLETPKEFYALKNGKRTDLLADLKETSVMGAPGWQAHHRITRPGVYQYVMVPKPYWEPAEDVHIIHYTKTIVAAYGEDQGWDEPAGLETEIIPLLRPFGNYQGNTFTGKVLLRGKPAANTEVEVELYNQKNVKASSDYHITQVVKTDDNGVFSFTCPFPGWWGFAALSEADYTIKDPDGKEKEVELGAVLWVYFTPHPTDIK